MSDFLQHLMKSGKQILVDTKTPATKEKREKVAKVANETPKPEDSDPHKVFVKRTISEKPPKEKVVVDLLKFIKAEEAKL